MINERNGCQPKDMMHTYFFIEKIYINWFKHENKEEKNRNKQNIIHIVMQIF
jgi:hypothetical protein